LAEDLELGHGTGITVISDSHKNKANHHNARRHKALYYSKIGRDEQKGMCKLWELSGIPCVHSVATYLFLNMVPDDGVDHWYSQERWFEAYQFSIKPIYGSNMWKKQPNKPLLPLIVVRMPSRPRKNRVKDKRNCDKEQLPKLPQMKKQPGRKREPNFNSYASNRDGGRGSREGGGEASGGIGQSNAARFQANTKRGESSGGRGRARGKGGRSGMARGRGSRGQGEGCKGGGRGVTTMLVDEEMEQILIEKEEKRIADEKAIQEEFDEEAVSTRVEYGTAYVQTQESIAQPSVAATETTPKGKTIEANVAEPPKLKKQGRKRKVAEPSAAEPPFRIYHKNRGRSERIFNQKIKEIGFGPNGEGSTANKAFSL
ncbi:hypothetical protein Tco_1246447, partial [Tanacetum coccineum]